MDENKSTKENIMDIAIRLFSQKGYEAIGVQEICNESKITKPTLYYYFGNKIGLLQNISDTYGNDFLAKIQEAASYEHDFQNSLTKILKTVIDFSKTHTDFFNLHCLLLNAPSDSEERLVYSTIENKIAGSLFEFFKKSSKEFGNMKGKEKIYSMIFNGNTLSIAKEMLRGNLKNNDQTIFLVVKTFLYGIAN